MLKYNSQFLNSLQNYSTFSKPVINNSFSQKKDDSKKQILELMNIKFKDNIQYYSKFLHYQNKTHSYSAQFFRSLALSTLQTQKKLYTFRQIKNALKNNKKVFTIQSSTKIIQNLCLFQFQGDQTIIINSLADYFQQNKLFFPQKLKNRFQIAYKDIMVNKAIGPVKFKAMDFSAEYTETQRKVKQLEINYKKIDKTCRVQYRKGFFIINLPEMHLKIFSFKNKMKKQQKDDLFISIKTQKKTKNLLLFQNNQLLSRNSSRNQQNEGEILKQLKQRLFSQELSIQLCRFQVQKTIQYCAKSYQLKHLKEVFAYISVLNFFQNFEYFHFMKEVSLKRPFQLSLQEDTAFYYKYLIHQNTFNEKFQKNLIKIDKRAEIGIIVLHEDDLLYFKKYFQKTNQKMKVNQVKELQQKEQKQQKLNLLTTLFQYNQKKAKFWKIMNPI